MLHKACGAGAALFVLGILARKLLYASVFSADQQGCDVDGSLTLRQMWPESLPSISKSGVTPHVDSTLEPTQTRRGVLERAMWSHSM